MLGNEFVKFTMEIKRWLLIDRCLQVQLSTVVDYFNLLSKQMWNLYPTLSIDDDLDLWKGKSGWKKHIQRKANKTGQISWKIVDKKRWIWYLFWESDVTQNKGNST